MRDDNGRFIKGHKATGTMEEKRIAGLIDAWKRRPDSISDIKHPYIYNCWRAIVHTEKGKRAGCSDEWMTYRQFHDDVAPTYQDGLRLNRIYKNQPFSVSNFIWVPDAVASNLRTNSILLSYNGETKTLVEWADQYSVSIAAMRIRYHRHKDYTADEIILGKARQTSRMSQSVHEMEYAKVRAKASKMCSSYRIRDKKKRLEFDLSPQWIIDNIFYKSCVYCGDTDKVGCDRKDNSMGHTKYNVQPCCSDCNTVRGDNFSHEEMVVLGKVIREIKLARRSIETLISKN